MDPFGVRDRKYSSYYAYMNNNNRAIPIVKYFRYKGEGNEKI